MSAKPWQISNIPGPKTASILKSGEAVAKILKKAKRPILIVGARIVTEKVNGEPLVKYVVELAKLGIPVVATAHSRKILLEHGVKPVATMPLINITNMLKDPEWKGFDGNGGYTHAIFFGITYYLQSQMLSALKHFAPKLITISLDKEYQPNATWSFPNLSEKDWKEALEKMISSLKGG